MNDVNDNLFLRKDHFYKNNIYTNRKGLKSLHIFLEDITYCEYENYNEIYNKFYTFLFDGINNKIAGKEELVRRFNIINSIQGNIAVKIRLKTINFI